MKYFAIHAIVLCVVFTEVFSKDNPRTSVREFLRYTISCNLASSIVLLHYLYSKAIVFNILHRRADKKTIPKAKGYEHIISLFLSEHLQLLRIAFLHHRLFAIECLYHTNNFWSAVMVTVMCG